MPIARQPDHGWSTGIGYLVLTLRDLTGLSQRMLAARIGTSQPAIAAIESGTRMPTLRTVLRAVDAAGYLLVIGLVDSARPPSPERVALDDFAMVGFLAPDPLDGLPNLHILREPPPWAGPHSRPSDLRE